MTRHFWVLVHRYCGLYMAFILIVAGLTGSILAFYHELDGWLNPERSPEHNRIIVQASPLLDPFELRERALKRIPEARIDLVNLTVKPEEAYSLMLQPRLGVATGKSFPLGFDNIALNPYTGEEIERNPTSPEQDGYFPLTRKNILQFVYALHYQLALGDVGMWLFWLAAVIWSLDCFVGFYLTLPPRRKQNTSPVINNHNLHVGVKLKPTELPAQVQKRIGFWHRWKPSWLIKWSASFFRVNFDLHRAFGLWFWLMLFIFAWSSVMLEIHVFNNLPPVYDSVMKVFFDHPPEMPIPNLPKPLPDPVIDFRSAYAIGQRLMAEQAKLQGFTVKDESLMYYDAGNGTYLYGACTDRDIAGVCSSTAVYFDAGSGKLLWLAPLPSGEYSGLTINTWLAFLHMATIWGLPYKLFVCFMGLMITMLSVTGVYIWLRKHRVARLKPKVLV
ncbi:MAG: PepSY domain-containing protein [Methyloglobulus sp.]|nr:PepSY domain-containing protein [Methyloglobulus sp.]